MSFSPTPELPWWARLSSPIVAGPLRGIRWLPACGGKIMRVFLGTYEREQTARFVSLIRPGDVVFDVGAAHGYYTLLSARLAGPAGKVVAFEPFPENAAFLRAHVGKNRFGNVVIRQEAVSDRNGTIGFGRGSGTGTGRIDASGTLQVPLRTLASVASELGLRPDHIKIDVEGAEMGVLRGAGSLLDSHPTLFLSTHGPDIHRECCEFLSARGYCLDPLDSEDLDSSTEVVALSPATAAQAVRSAA